MAASLRAPDSADTPEHLLNGSTPELTMAASLRLPDSADTPEHLLNGSTSGQSAVGRGTESASQNPATAFLNILLKFGLIFRRGESIITEVEDDVIGASKIVKDEAKAIERVAEGVKQISKIVEQDADKVEALVDKVKVNSESMNKELNEVMNNLEGQIKGKPKSPSLMASGEAEEKVRGNGGTDFMDFGWGWSTFRAFLLLFTFLVAYLHLRGQPTNLTQGPGREDGAASQLSNSQFLHIAMINLGPIFKILKFLRGALSRQERILTEVQGGVDGAAEAVKGAAKAIEHLAEGVEKLSTAAEHDAQKVEDLIEKVKASSGSMQQELKEAIDDLESSTQGVVKQRKLATTRGKKPSSRKGSIKQGNVADKQNEGATSK